MSHNQDFQQTHSIRSLPTNLFKTTSMQLRMGLKRTLVLKEKFQVTKYIIEKRIYNILINV